MKKNLLLGNGINIQMGGLAYTSKFIMDRVKFKARIGEYEDLFEGTLKPKEIEGILDAFVNIANDIRSNQYDNYKKDEYFEEAIQDFKSRYSEDIKQPHDIMLEDWFLLIHAFFVKNDDLTENKEGAIAGFERLILDGIYNEGKIQELYKNVTNKKVRKFLGSYDNIFTLNYDDNIDLMTGKTVYHLHGDYTVLANSENDHVINGFLRKQKGQLVYQKKFRHCYCNALLNFSGGLKIKKVEELENAKKIGQQLLEKCQNSEDELEKLKSLKINDLSGFEYIYTKIEHPELEFTVDYHFEEFRNMEGELHIIGMSPNNDNHIFNIIFENPKLRQIVFYYKSESDRKYIEKYFKDKRIVCKQVDILWAGLNWKKPILNHTFLLPDGMDILEICRVFSAYDVSKEDILKSAGSFSEGEVQRLCALVTEDMKKRNPSNQSTDERTFNIQRFSISYIALQEGILPPALYLLYIKNAGNK